MALAQQKGCSAAQIALAWLLAQWEGIVPIPGTRRLTHLADNLGALSVLLSPAELGATGQAIRTLPVAGSAIPPRG